MLAALCQSLKGLLNALKPCTSALVHAPPCLTAAFVQSARSFQEIVARLHETPETTEAMDALEKCVLRLASCNLGGSDRHMLSSWRYRIPSTGSESSNCTKLCGCSVACTSAWPAMRSGSHTTPRTCHRPAYSMTSQQLHQPTRQSSEQWLNTDDSTPCSLLLPVPSHVSGT